MIPKNDPAESPAIDLPFAALDLAAESGDDFPPDLRLLQDQMSQGVDVDRSEPLFLEHADQGVFARAVPSGDPDHQLFANGCPPRSCRVRW